MVIETPEPERPAHFYAALLDLRVTFRSPQGTLIAGAGKALMFQPVDGYTPPQWPDPARPQQAHLDVIVDDLDAGEARALELGATLLADGPQFRVFADPSGHPFCLTLQPADPHRVSGRKGPQVANAE